MEPLVSIVVPVYNAASFLPECIGSIRRQTCENWELLLIDDGSQDASGTLCDEYAAQDERIRAVHIANGGQARARNRGLEQAKGEYLLFVDADDFLAGDTVLETLVETARGTCCDIAVGDYARFWKGSSLPAASAAELAALNRDSETFRFRGFYSGGSLSYVWGRLYRCAFLEEHALRLPLLSYAEDKVFNLHCYFCGARYAFTGRICYQYRMNPASISYRYRPDSCAQWLTAARQIDADLQAAGGAAAWRDVVWYTIVFAAFFDAKMEYVQHSCTLHPVRALLADYNADPLAQQAFSAVMRGECVREIGQRLWQWMLRGFSAAMRLHAYGALGLGIKLLVDLRIDERLSDTGLRE